MKTAPTSRMKGNGDRATGPARTGDGPSELPLGPAVAPGCGAPPEKAGLYWVREGQTGKMLAVVEGLAPFLRVKLLDPWDGDCRLNPTAREMEELVWLGEIAVPAGGAR